MEITTQTLQLANPNNVDSHIIRSNKNGYYHLVKKREINISNCSSCFFWVPGKYMNCFRKEYTPVIPECCVYKKIPVQDSFGNMMLEVSDKFGLRSFNSLYEIYEQLTKDPRSLYIQTYNLLLTKGLLHALKRPCRELGYGLSLTVFNDELTLYYYKDDETRIESDE